MSTGLICVSVFAGVLLGATPVYADFQSALGEYNAGHYDVAHAQFLALAELGDCSSQFNLGAMALKGQGGPKDLGTGVGWLQAAADNGCTQLVGDKLARLQTSLSADESRAAAQIVARYGREALHAEGIINPDFSCREDTPASVLSVPAPEVPHSAEGRPEGAIVVAAFTIGVDGRARDPEILLAVPDEAFAAAAVEAWLNASFTPASRHGQPVESRLQTKQVFSIDGVTLANSAYFSKARSAAERGDPPAEYLVGVAATLDPALGISYAKAGRFLLGSARDGDADAQYWVGSQLRASSRCHPRADGAVWLQHAAEGGNAAAQLALATELLGASASAEQTAQARALLEKAAASNSYYVRKHVVALLAASPVAAVRDPPTALGVARKLAAGAIQSDPQMFEALAAAYAANGDFRNAAERQELAIRKAESLGWNTRAMSARLAAYRSDKAWSGDLFAA
jgi:TPR repeat protein